MITSILSHFGYGLIACFIGGLPLGIINVSVINISLKKSYRTALHFAAGSASVEILEASVALIFGLAIEVYLREHQEVGLIIFLVFMALGSYFLLRKPKQIVSGRKVSNHKKQFLNGMLIALLNPQAIPFWLFALAFVAPYHVLDFVGNNLYFFLAGVFAGKFISLLLFAKTARYLHAHLNRNHALMDRVLGSILIILAIIEAGRYF